MSLLGLRRNMRAWLTSEDAAAAARLGVSAGPGLRVHQNNYRSQLVTCLESSFAKTLSWIGGEAFLGAAATHIDRVPPSSWTLDAYGRDFPDTLAILYPGDPEIAELARIELALEEAFVGSDCAALTVADMADVDWDSAVLRLVPTLEMILARTNAAALWSALSANEMPPPATLLDGPEATLVWSQNLQARLRTIDQIELQALLNVRSGISFEALCAETASAFGHDEAAAVVGGWLGRWIGDGLIAAIEAPHSL